MTKPRPLRLSELEGALLPPVDLRVVVHAMGFGPGGEFSACTIAFDEWDEGSISYVSKPISCPNCILELERPTLYVKKRGKWVRK